MPAILLFGHHGVEAVFAIGVAAGCEKPGNVIATILITADGAVKLGLHSFLKIYIIKNKHITIIPVLKLRTLAK